MVRLWVDEAAAFVAFTFLDDLVDLGGLMAPEVTEETPFVPALGRFFVVCVADID